MNTVTAIVIITIVLAVGVIYYQKRLSARAILDKAKQEAENSINTDEEIYSRMVMCIVLNGGEFESAEEVEEDIVSRDKTLSDLEKKGHIFNVYKNLDEVKKKIYLIINGYDLKLFPNYVVTKAMNSIENSS